MHHGHETLLGKPNIMGGKQQGRSQQNNSPCTSKAGHSKTFHLAPKHFTLHQQGRSTFHLAPARQVTAKQFTLHQFSCILFRASPLASMISAGPTL